MFKAVVLRKDESGFRPGVEALQTSQLPAVEQGAVLVRPRFSTLNYKDALALTDRSPVVRRWPMVAGIDGAGEVLESEHPDWRAGDAFVVNGWGLGETHWGCMSQQARLKGEWLVRLPEAFSALQAMAIGTAGYTAMLCVMALERHGLAPGDGEVLVTGATGGVGSVAVALLSRLGYRVVAATGKAQAADYLKALGATELIDRAALATPGKPLQKERWAGVVDAVGSHTLANACAQVRYGGVVAACGLAQGADLPTTVMPFILRGVTLAGVDSVMAPMGLRQEAWRRLARDLDPQQLQTMIHRIDMSQVLEAAGRLMAGQIQGRIVVDLS